MNDYYTRIINLQKRDFEGLALELFKKQFNHNPIYKEYCELLKIHVDDVIEIQSIPFLPIQFYKTHIIKSANWLEEKVFLSSGTGMQVRSQQFVKSIDWYNSISLKIFKDQVIKKIKSNHELVCVGLLPGYIDNPHSSLIHMIHSLSQSLNQNGSLIFSDIVDFNEYLNKNANDSFIVFGVSFALFDWSSQFKSDNNKIFIIETGGMKTDKRNLSKNEILAKLQTSFPNATILSEYGMTELMSQAYSNEDFKYNLAPWMKVVITAIDDPFSQIPNGKRGRINIIDLANVDTCCFIQTADVGILYDDNRFEVLGRLQDEELRGCNFMV